jgi:hypothetical protein
MSGGWLRKWMPVVATLLSMQAGLYAQGGRGAAAAPANAKAAAPADLTGQWVSVVTEDWRYRMMVPGKGDYAGVPLTPAGRKLADGWDPMKDEAEGNACKAFGPPGVMRAPGRIRISWADDDTMKLETDAGTQTRMFYFKDAKSAAGDLQGVSVASWEALAAARAGGNPGTGGPRPTGALKVVTTNMKPGYLRLNGVPYSDKAVLTEYFDRTNEANGDSWLVDTAILEDPMYLNQPFVTSAHFRKETNLSTWHPTACSVK